MLGEEFTLTEVKINGPMTFEEEIAAEITTRKEFDRPAVVIATSCKATEVVISESGQQLDEVPPRKGSFEKDNEDELLSEHTAE